jgi:ribosomal protein L16 Arg81 hydroxylase
MLPYCADAAWRNSNIWMGGPGTIARMHRDLADNLHIQVFGRKRFTLVAPAQSSMIYPNTLFDKFPNGCRSDIEQPDFDRFPKMRGVEPWIAELDPGDAIYIPRRWWHHVRTLAISMAVNYWWASGRHRFIVQAADYVKRIRGLSR